MVKKMTSQRSISPGGAADAEPTRGHVVAFSKLPPLFPTHRHDAAFWASLGRAVATFGFLEETAKKAILALTGSIEVPEDRAAAAVKQWHEKLQRTIVNPLGGLIDTFQKEARSHPKLRIKNFTELEKALRKAAQVRNVICHGSWRPPNEQGASVPFFVSREPVKQAKARKSAKRGKTTKSAEKPLGKLVVFNTPVDVAWLDQLQRHTAELACEVINTVTHMGYEFPGSGSGLGKKLV